MFERALEHADMRVLLMVLYHMTGDPGWLSPPFTPKRDVRLIPDRHAGLPEEARARIRSAALDLLDGNQREPTVRDPGDKLITRMMSVCLGEAVPDEYALLTREEMGLVSRDVAWGRLDARRNAASIHVLIVGAGISGIALAVRLKRLGIPFTIVEKHANVGGTWYVNRYPGCGVDTPNHAFSFSFGQRYPWSRYFSLREEIENYLQRVVAEFGLREHICFETYLQSASWDPERSLWSASVVASGRTRIIHSQFLVSAIGQFSDPSVPKVAGAAEFRGTQFHSADWPDNLDISGKDIAVIGNGASAMQIVPSVADHASRVTIYQRTPQWARPIAGYGEPIDEGTQWLLQNMPLYAEWFRFNMFWRYGDGLHALLQIDPAWPHRDRSINEGNERHRIELTDYIHRKLAHRPDLISKCVPNYPPFGKRILLDKGWYDTICRPDVDLVDTPIERLEKNGVRTSDGQTRPASIIVWATGFKLTEMAARLGITGTNGVTLAEAWADDNPTAYLGTSVSGFPNFFCMLGPNSGLAHGGSTMLQAECQARYITSCMVAAVEKGLRSMAVRSAVQYAYNAKVDAAHERMIWSHTGMSSYYRNRHGRVFSAMPWRIVDYWSMTRAVNLSDYAVSA